MNMISKFVPATGWTPENEATLTRLWAEGVSTHDIAEALGEWCNRNKVIGKANRLGLPEHANVRNGSLIARQQRKREKRAVQRRKPKVAPVVALKSATPVPAAPVACVEPEAPAVDHRVTIERLRMPISQCRWIDGEPTADALYCGAPTGPGISWCKRHNAQLTVPFRERANIFPSRR